MTETLFLKKYTNRRLYDTERSTYVTLEEVSEMIKAGRTIEVIDAKTKTDVTSFILTQIILEESKKHSMLPVSLLHLIIRYGDNILSEFFEHYLAETLKIYINSKKAFDTYFRQWLQMGINFSGVKSKNSNEMNPFSNLLDAFEKAALEKEQISEKDENKI